MFSRFRNLFSKSKSEAEEDPEADTQTNRGGLETSTSAINGSSYSGTILSEETETQLFEHLQKTVHEPDIVLSDQVDKAASITTELLNDMKGKSEVAAIQENSNGNSEAPILEDAVTANQRNDPTNQTAVVTDSLEDLEILSKLPGTLHTIVEDLSSETSANEAENVELNQITKKTDESEDEVVVSQTNGEENALPIVNDVAAVLEEKNQTAILLVEDAKDSPQESIDVIAPFTDIPLTTETDVEYSVSTSEDSSTIYLDDPDPLLDDDSFDTQTTTSLASASSAVTSAKDTSIDSSIVVEDLCAELPPTPVDSKDDPRAEADNAEPAVAAEPSHITINPIGNNALACNAIAQKLNEIAEVAESLDAAIRDVQHNAEVHETHAGSSEKKLETLRSNSSEDWHSRSTEDESFATASEGNFTPHSHSSSFQTASGRTSSYIDSSKNSFDASEADDSTFAFDMPELTSPLHNMSFDSSEHSFLSAQHSPSTFVNDDSETRNLNKNDDDNNSVAGVEELHSQSVTPTPGDAQYAEGIPIESEHELESCISDAPTLEVLTESTPVSSVMPEVSGSACSNLNQLRTNTKPNAAWRRSKYYENITKQTIKGFL